MGKREIRLRSGKRLTDIPLRSHLAVLGCLGLGFPIFLGCIALLSIATTVFIPGWKYRAFPEIILMHMPGGWSRTYTANLSCEANPEGRVVRFNAWNTNEARRFVGANFPRYELDRLDMWYSRRKGMNNLLPRD
jgi:hypothetical protein